MRKERKGVEQFLGTPVVPFSEMLWGFGFASAFGLLLSASFLHAPTLMAVACRASGPDVKRRISGRFHDLPR
jgi:hypothetical protein